MWDVMAQTGWGVSDWVGVMCSQEGTALLGNCPGAGGGSFCSSQVKFASREQEDWNYTEPGLETASLTPPRFELSQGCGVPGMLHNHLRNTPTRPPPQTRAGMFPERQRSLGTTDPSQGCSSHRPEPHFFPLPAPWPGVSEQGRAGVSGGGGLFAPRARSCGCASCSTFLRLRLRLPPGACGWGGGFPVVPMPRGRDNTQDNTQQPPGAPPSILGMVQREGARHKGCAKHQVRPSPSSSSSPRAKAFPGAEIPQGTVPPSLAVPAPCPGVAALAPGSPSLLLSGRRQPRRAAAPRGRRWGRAGGSHQGRRPLFGVQPTPCHPPRGLPTAPSPRWPHSRRDVLPPRALETAAALPRSLPSPPGGRCRRRVVHDAPRVPVPGLPSPPVPGPRRWILQSGSRRVHQHR